MKTSYLSALVAAVAIAAASVSTIALSAPGDAPSISTPVTLLKYFATGVKSSTGGELQAAPAYGDLGKSSHATFIKMPAGFVSDTHIHSEDYYGVVISGVGVNTQANGRNDVPLPVGSYWLQKGGEPHVTKCISPNECIFFISQPGKFDYLPSAKK